jgi:hypothetical protein
MAGSSAAMCWRNMAGGEAAFGDQADCRMVHFVPLGA